MSEPEHIGNIVQQVMPGTTRQNGVLRITIDTREQLPWAFADFPMVQAAPGTLQAGDYRADGATFTVERKSPADFLGSITHGRERFERELEKLAVTGGAIVVEGSLADVLSGRTNRRPDGRLRVHQNAILATIAAFLMRYQVATYFAGSRLMAEQLAYHLLRQSVKHAEQQCQVAETITEPTAEQTEEVPVAGL